MGCFDLTALDRVGLGGWSFYWRKSLGMAFYRNLEKALEAKLAEV